LKFRFRVFEFLTFKISQAFLGSAPGFVRKLWKDRFRGVGSQKKS